MTAERLVKVFSGKTKSAEILSPATRELPPAEVWSTVNLGKKKKEIATLNAPCSSGHLNVWEPLFEASTAGPEEMKLRQCVSKRLKITQTEAHPHLAVQLLQPCHSHYLKRRSENLHICAVGTSYKACSMGKLKQLFQTHKLVERGRKEKAPTRKQVICDFWNYQQCQLSLMKGIRTCALRLEDNVK